jgi:hypothetical protein
MSVSPQYHQACNTQTLVFKKNVIRGHQGGEKKRDKKDYLQIKKKVDRGGVPVWKQVNT